jgi:hypothetical protein
VKTDALTFAAALIVKLLRQAISVPECQVSSKSISECSANRIRSHCVSRNISSSHYSTSDFLFMTENDPIVLPNLVHWAPVGPTRDAIAIVPTEATVVGPKVG